MPAPCMSPNEIRLHPACFEVYLHELHRRASATSPKFMTSRCPRNRRGQDKPRDHIPGGNNKGAAGSDPVRRIRPNSLARQASPSK